MVLQICLVSWGSECMSPSQGISCWPVRWLGACFDAAPQSCVPVESWGWIWMFSLNHACNIWLLIAACAPEWVIFPNPLFLYRKIICFLKKPEKSSVENIIRVQWDRCGCPLYTQCFCFPLLNFKLITNMASKPWIKELLSPNTWCCCNHGSCCSWQNP